MFILPAFMVKQATVELIITARVRSTTGGYVFTGGCLFNFRGGGGELPHPADWGGGFTPYPIQLIGRDGYPIPGPGRGVPHAPDWGNPNPGLDGVPPVQTWDEVTPQSTKNRWSPPPHPDLGWGIPPSKTG